MAKKELVKEARKLAIEYDRLQSQQKLLGGALSEHKSSLKRLLKDMEIDRVDVPAPDDSGKVIRVSIHKSGSVSYDTEKLLPVLKEKGLLKKVCNIVVDAEKLEAAHRVGLISHEEIKGAAIVRESEVFKVSRVKKKKKD